MSQKKKGSVSVAFCLAFGITFVCVMALLFAMVNALERKTARVAPPREYELKEQLPEPHKEQRITLDQREEQGQFINGKWVGNK